MELSTKKSKTAWDIALHLDLMCLATLREAAIANRLSSVVRDARFAEHHAQHALLKCCMITWSPTFLITFVLGSELVHLLNAKVKSNATIVLAIIGLIF